MPHILIMITVFMLFLGAVPLPYYPYYPILRFVVTGVFIWAAYESKSRKRSDLLWCFGIGAILFNPILQIHFPKLIWSIIDISYAVILLFNKKSLINQNGDDSGIKEIYEIKDLFEKYDKDYPDDEITEETAKEIDNKVEVIENSKNELNEKLDETTSNHPATTFTENLQEPRLGTILFSRKVNGKIKWFKDKDEDEDNDQKYEGEIINGKPNGIGIINYTNGNKYEGEVKNGERHGKGKQMSPDGTWQEGEWDKDKATGNFIFYQNDKITFEGILFDTEDDLEIEFNGKFFDDDGNLKIEGHFKGKGNVEDPILDGIGCIYLNGGKAKGEFKSGALHGKGLLHTPEGQIYEGEFKKGKFHGHGASSYPNGEKYSGEWKDNEKHGYGRRVTADGTKYVGEWRDGKRHGEGTLSLLDGEKYEGGFIQDKKHGQGTVTYSEGEKFEGEWNHGMVLGEVTYILENGSKYKGERKNGIFHGNGKRTLPDGDVYEGAFKDGKSHGLGTYTSSDGTLYTGRWKNGKFHGQGALYSKNSNYKGEWKDGKRNGEGSETFPNGGFFKGKFKQDKPWKGKQYDNNSELIGEIVAGVEK
jgi:hypothetical protein